MKTWSFVLLATLLLAACGPDGGKQPKIAEPQREALDKAKGVENTLQQSAQQQQQESDKQTQ